MQKVELGQNTNGCHQDNSDHCSPFCTCDCCISPIVYKETNFQFNVFSFAEENFIDYLFNYNSDLSYSIWQPPKLS
jgi:hypothetical protein